MSSGFLIKYAPATIEALDRYKVEQAYQAGRQAGVREGINAAHKNSTTAAGGTASTLTAWYDQEEEVYGMHLFEVKFRASFFRRRGKRYVLVDRPPFAFLGRAFCLSEIPITFDLHTITKQDMFVPLKKKLMVPAGLLSW